MSADEMQSMSKRNLALWTEGAGGGGGEQEVSVLQVQAWQLLFPDQRLFGADTGHGTATACLKKQCHMGHTATQPNHATYCQNHDSTAQERGPLKLLNAFFL